MNNRIGPFGKPKKMIFCVSCMCISSPTRVDLPMGQSCCSTPFSKVLFENASEGKYVC